MNRIIEEAKLEPGPTFENTINEIKYNHLQTITSVVMNLSSITFFDKNFKQAIVNIRIEVTRFKPGPTFEKTIIEIKETHLKSSASAAINLLYLRILTPDVAAYIPKNDFPAEFFSWTVILIRHT